MTISKIGTDPFNNTITIEQQQRRQGLYIIGSTGRGKTVLLENLIMQEITQGIGLCVLDPHRDLTRRIIELMPTNRLQDVILLDIANNDYAFGLNLYSSPTQSVKDVQYAIERIMHIWERLFNISRLTPQMVQYMRKCAETLIPNSGYTMAEIRLLFEDIPLRNKLLQNVTDPVVVSFWKRHDAMSKYNKEQREEQILNKLDEFLTGMVIPIIGQSQSTLDFRTLMDTRPGKIILVQLDPNLDSITSLIGSMIVALVRNAAFSRENILQNKRKHFSVYADEFDRFATLDFKSIMDECRKYGIAATIAHQTRDVLHRDIPGLVRSTLQGNLVVFQITSPDAEELAGNFDTTPPPPKPEEVGRQEILVPKQNGLTHLLKEGHKNQLITDFINQWIRPIINSLELQKINAVQGSYASLQRADTDVLLKQIYERFDQLFYTAMVGKNGYLPIPIETIDIISSYIDCSDYFSVMYNLQHVLQFASPEYAAMYDILTSSNIHQAIMQNRLTLLNTALMQERERLYDNLKSTQKATVNNIKGTFYKGPWRDVIAPIHTHFPWMRKEEITTDKWQQLVRDVNEYGLYYEDVHKPTVWYLNNCYHRLWYTQQDVENQVNASSLPKEQNNFENFIRQLRAVLLLLSQEDNWIKTGSGQYQPLMRPGQQLSSVEMINRTANLLSSLSVLHAYTRVGGTIQACWNCGDQPFNNDPYCTLCGKKLKPEYHLTITPASQGLPKRVVDARIDAIVQANVRDGYLRKRSDVLAEIQARQQPPPPPAPAMAGQQAVQPPAQPKPFQAPPPLPQARRKVPKPKVCPDCSHPNDPAANFCMKCGKKL